MIARLRSLLSASEFTRHASRLATGTLAGQLIALGGAPLLTRIFAPSEFGPLAAYLAVVSTIGPAVALRYDVAVVSVSERELNRELAVLALLVATASAALVGLVVVLLRSLGWVEQSAWQSFLPVGAFLAGAHSTLRSLVSARSLFGSLGIAAVVQATLNLMVSVGGVVVPGTRSGVLLVAANIAGVAGGVAFLMYTVRWELRTSLPSFSAIVSLARRFSDFPRYSATAAVVDGAMLAMPVYFLAKYYGDAVVGQYSLVLRVATVPLLFISQSISQVNTRTVTLLVSSGGNAANHLDKLIGFLSALVLLPTLLALAFGTEIFSFAFGPQWEQAGALFSVWMPAMAVRFVASTLSGVWGPTGHNRLGATWKASAFVTLAVTYSLAAPRVPLLQLVVIVASVEFVANVVHLCSIRFAVAHPKVK